jgi:hypothetical protein
MAKNNSDEPRTLKNRKYQKRRYYDRTRSGHLSLQQIHKLIIEGFHSRGSTGPISIVPGCPPERSGLIARVRPSKFVPMQKTFWRVSEIRAIFHSEAQESPGALTTKNKAKK